MNRKRLVRPVLMALVGLGLTFLVIGWLPGGLELSITPLKGGAPVKGCEPLMTVPLEPGERFTLHYKHSVNHLPIWEEHAADEQGRIFVETERFVSFNAGMGHIPGQGRHTERGGYQVIEGLHRPVGDMVLRVGGPGVDHTILWRGGKVNLTAVAAGQAVRIKVQPRSLLYTWWRRLCPHRATPQIEAK